MRERGKRVPGVDAPSFSYGEDVHPYRVRVIFAAACLLTADGCLLAARMGRHTTRPGWIQAVGGSAVADDVVDGFFDPVRSVRRELAEETGLDLGGGAMRGATVAGWTLDANGSVSVAVRIDLDATAATAITMIEYHLQRMRRAGEVPELAEVVAIPLGRKGLQWLQRQPVSQGRYLRGYLTAPELQRF